MGARYQNLAGGETVSPQVKEKRGRPLWTRPAFLGSTELLR